MVPDAALEEQEEKALDLIRDEEGDIAVMDITHLSDEELTEEEIEGEEILDENLSEDFIKEVQEEAVVRMRLDAGLGVPKTGESLDDFIARKEKALHEGTQEEEESEASDETSSETPKTFKLKIGGKTFNE